MLEDLRYHKRVCGQLPKQGHCQRNELHNILHSTKATLLLLHRSSIHNSISVIKLQQQSALQRLVNLLMTTAVEALLQLDLPANRTTMHYTVAKTATRQTAKAWHR